MHPVFQAKLGLTTSDDVFEFIMATLKPRFGKPDYFVDWKKVVRKTKDIEIALHSLDYILGKDDVEEALFDVIQRNPKVAEAIPHVFAAGKEREFIIVSATIGDYLNTTEYSFDSSKIVTEDDIKKIVHFCKLIGLLDFIKKANFTKFTHFVYGVETGLDSNGRKNRSGKQMEEIVEFYLHAICKRNNKLIYRKQANHKDIFHTFTKRVKVDKINRKFDFAVDTPNGLHLLETNFYGSNGSKLKATAGEYSGLYQFLKQDNHSFIWITDGQGWLESQEALREAFDKVDYILNLEMLNRGILEDLLLG
jgi:type II restriction enzyme